MSEHVHGAVIFALHLQTFPTSYMLLILCRLSYHCTANTNQARST